MLHTLRLRPRRAFTMLELIVVLTMVGVMAAIVVPRFRVSAKGHVRIAARQLMQDAESVRNRSLSTKKITRMQFNTGANSYVGYGDHDGDGALTAVQAEITFVHAFGTKVFENGVIFGRGNAGAGIPGEAGVGAVTFGSTRIDFDTRGTPTPIGTKGTIYLTSSTDPRAVFAVSMSAAGGYRLWQYLPNGTWQ